MSLTLRSFLTVTVMWSLVVACSSQASTRDGDTDPSGDLGEGNDQADVDGDGAGGGDADASADGGSSTPSRGGTITFTDIGAAGWWGRRVLADPGDAICDVQDELLDLGFGTEHCCRTRHEVSSDALTPFDQQMHLIVRGPLEIERFAVYQPSAGGTAWTKASSWERGGAASNLQITPPDGMVFDGSLGNACHAYLMQEIPFPCGPGSDPYCPVGGPDVNYEGWSGSKLIVFDAAMPYAAGSQAASCADDGAGWTDAPWIGFSASELMRDGWGKYHPCHCYANTDGGVGDGCGEINVFEVVSEAEGPQFGNREVMSTGLRSFQFGHLGGSVCGTEGCGGLEFLDADVDLFDACDQSPVEGGARLSPNGGSGCPVWRRPTDRRYLFALLDTATRTVQIGVLHPDAIPASVGELFPSLPDSVSNASIAEVLALRLPAFQ